MTDPKLADLVDDLLAVSLLLQVLAASPTPTPGLLQSCIAANRKCQDTTARLLHGDTPAPACLTGAVPTLH